MTDPDMATAVLGLLWPLLAARVGALSVELQAVFASRLDEVVEPLRDMVVAMQGWTAQVACLLEQLEDVDGKFALANSSVLLAPSPP